MNKFTLDEDFILDKENEEEKEQEVKDLGYRQKVFDIKNKYDLRARDLQNQFYKDVEEISQFNKELQIEKRKLLEDRYSRLLDSLYADRDKEIREVYEKELNRLEDVEIRTLDDLNYKEMIYIQTILDSKDSTQIKNLVERFIDNKDVENMVRATMTNLDEFHQETINSKLNDRQDNINKLKEELRSVGENNPFDKISFFREY